MTVENTIARYEKYLALGQADKAYALKEHMLKASKYKGNKFLEQFKPKEVKKKHGKKSKR